jgi:hypothetical protein
METREDKIRALAHRLWDESGRPEGKEGEHWSQAEKIVDEQNSVAAQSPKDPTRENRNRA